MEGFFILIFIGFVVYSTLNSSKKTSTAAKKTKPLNPLSSYDIPESLKAKWEQSDNAASTKMSSNQRGQQSLSRQQAANQSARKAANAQNLWKIAQSGSESLKRQSKSAKDRNAAQKKMFSQSGKGQPVDKNSHRRADWGRRGHLGGGWVQPIFISLISAAALAGLFAVN